MKAQKYEDDIEHHQLIHLLNITPPDARRAIVCLVGDRCI